MTRVRRLNLPLARVLGRIPRGWDGGEEPKDRTNHRDRAMTQTFGVIGWKLPGGFENVVQREAKFLRG